MTTRDEKLDGIATLIDGVDAGRKLVERGLFHFTNERQGAGPHLFVVESQISMCQLALRQRSVDEQRHQLGEMLPIYTERF